MLTPEELDNIADPIVELFSKLEENMLIILIGTLLTIDLFKSQEEVDNEKMIALGAMMLGMNNATSKTLTETAEELIPIFEQATMSNFSGLTAEDILRMLDHNSMAYQALVKGASSTEALIYNLTNSTAVSTQTAFFNAVDKAYLQVHNGDISYNSAIANAVNDILEQGYPYVVYPSGHHDAVDVAVRRAVLTGVNQTEGQVALATADELGLDYVDVSAHMGARPSHAEWQGKRYCISGKDPAFRKFDEATGYGTGTGLCGWNCRHTFFPTTRNAPPYYSDEELKEIASKTVHYNGQEMGYYDATQMQRSMERESRKLRKDIVALDELPDSPEKDALFGKASADLKAVEAQYKDFSKQTGLLTQNERMRVYGYNKNLSQQVGIASREYLAGRAKVISPFDSISSVIEKAEDVKDIENALITKYWFKGITGKDYSISLDGTDLESAKSIARATTKVMEKYPQLIRKFEGVEVLELSTSTAGRSNFEGYIQANKLFYGDYDVFVKSYENAILENETPINTSIDAVMFHEYGHAIEGYLSKQFSTDNIATMMQTEVLDVLGASLEDIEVAVSKYATENEHEWFAECFAEYMDSSAPRAMAQTLGLFIDAIMEKIK